MASKKKKKTVKGKTTAKPTTEASSKSGEHGGFDPRSMDQTVIAIPLLEKFEEDRGLDKVYDVIIDVNLEYSWGRQRAKEEVIKLIDELEQEHGGENAKADKAKSKFSHQYIYGRLQGRLIQDLVERDKPKDNEPGCVYRIWPDFEVSPLIFKSVSTVKADAARQAFSAYGDGITWAVMDSGIKQHAHFKTYENLTLSGSLKHRDFSDIYDEGDEAAHANALNDEFGHGTHVAGIIAGAVIAKDGTHETGSDPNASDDNRKSSQICAIVNARDKTGKSQQKEISDIPAISGMAPYCKLLSLKVLDKRGKGKASNLIAAIEYIQEINNFGRDIRIHGVNMSVGYGFDAEWFACGQSPLCVEVDRLVKSGVVVVVAAGNTGYGAKLSDAGQRRSGMDLTINDPGNAELAITVGATHRYMPHTYGVSYFSSKGPTGDGRMKPDLVAPGEKIISCAIPSKVKNPEAGSAGDTAYYIEESGTSMAAPHVSGVIAAFLSIRSEFKGKPDQVKEIFLSTATDLKRAPYFQGRGLIDLMRAIQAV